VFRKFVWLFVIFPVGAVLVAFALANRHTVRLNLDPFSSQDPFLAIDAPFFLFLLSALITGLLLGGFVTWLGQGKWRKEARNRALESRALRAETQQLNTQLRAVSESPLDRAQAAE
jgi:uncharacterized integral membrane protein